jgi:hypothetical protein
MSKAWNAGLYQQPADFAILKELWEDQNQTWTIEWQLVPPAFETRSTAKQLKLFSAV